MVSKRGIEPRGTPRRAATRVCHFAISTRFAGALPRYACVRRTGREHAPGRTQCGPADGSLPGEWGRPARTARAGRTKSLQLALARDRTAAACTCARRRRPGPRRPVALRSPWEEKVPVASGVSDAQTFGDRYRLRRAGGSRPRTLSACCGVRRDGWEAVNKSTARPNLTPAVLAVPLCTGALLGASLGRSLRFLHSL